MNLYDAQNMKGQDIISQLCPFCGRPASNLHHIVPRSHGGKKGPLVSVCGFGNASGCHGRLHSHELHMRWNEGWEYLETDEPVKIERAMEMEGWKRL